MEASAAAATAVASDGSARSEKERANRAYASGNYEAALEAYAAALAAIGPGKGKEAQELRSTLHSNRAACHLQLKRFAECIEEATDALALNPHMIKALYRRAQACERLGQLEPALRDLRQALRLDPHNRDVLGAARRVGEGLQALLQARSPVAQMLDLVRSSPPLPAADDDEVVEGERRRRKEALMGLVGLASQEPQAAYDVLREADVLVALLEREGEPEERLLAFRLLAACCAHPEFVRRAFDDDGGGGDASGGLARVLEENDEDEKEKAEELTLVKITLFLRLHKALGPAASASASASAPGDENGAGGSASGALVEQALDCWCRALRSSNRTVQDAGLDALLWWCSGAETSTGGGGGLTVPASVAAAFFADDQPQARRRLGPLLSLLTLEHGDDEPSLTSLQTKGAHVLGRLLSAARVATGAEGAQAIVARALGDAAVAATGEGSLLVLLAAFLADPALGVKALEEDQGGAAQRLQLAAMAGASRTDQTLAAEVLNAAASSEPGRRCLGAVLEDAPAVLQALMVPSAARGARVAAASAFTKLGLAAKALSSASSELAGLFTIAVRELHCAVDANHKDSSAPTVTVVDDGDGGASVDRALEVLCCLVTRTAFKDELTHGSGRCRSCVPLLVKLALDAAAGQGKDAGKSRANATYGLAFVLASLCVSNDELRKEALRERDVSPEEYEQLQRIQQLQQPGPGADGGGAPAATQDEADPPERVQGRIKELVKADGVRALAQLARLPGAGARTQEQVGMALAAVATLEECRGLMVQQGAYNACLELGKEGRGLPDEVRGRALHAVAKVLVTTNPAVLSDRQRATAVPNLLWLCRWAKATNLQQFEALMALTNLAAADEGCLEAVAAHKGVPCFQALQYSEHPLVRRAATEAMCNLACHPKALQHLGDPEKLKIWLALAEAYEGEGGDGDGDGDEDLPTARAAAGALAMASGDEGVARALAAAGAGRVWAALLRSGNQELVHRAAIVVRNMARFSEPRARLQEDEALGTALSRLLEGGAAAPLTPLPAPVLSALHEAQRALKNKA